MRLEVWKWKEREQEGDLFDRYQLRSFRSHVSAWSLKKTVPGTLGIVKMSPVQNRDWNQQWLLRYTGYCQGLSALSSVKPTTSEVTGSKSSRWLCRVSLREEGETALGKGIAKRVWRGVASVSTSRGGWGAEQHQRWSRSFIASESESGG